jgi:hypothetical protein
MENKKTPNINSICIGNDNNVNNKNNDKLKLKLLFIYDLNLVIKDKKMNISDLKYQINKNYSIQDDEYELFIGETCISNMPNDTPILNILNDHKVDKIRIKSFKNLFDIQDQVNEYENFLKRTISLKDEEMALLNNETEKLLQDLNSI